MPAPLILAFDTSAAHCAAAVLSGEAVLAARHEAMERGQAERLFALIDEVLAEAGAGFAEIDALAVGTGPGNFTGIRIAVAAARGLALSLGRPAIGVSSFEALAEGAAGPVLAAVDARRGQSWLALVPGGRPLLAAPQTLDPARLELPAAALVVGHDAAAFAARLGLASAAPRAPLAVAIGRVALCRLGTAQPRPAPLYLREADAAPPADRPPVLLP